MVKRVIDGRPSGKITVLVNTAAARDNIDRLAKSLKWKLEVAEQGEEILLTLVK
ncbi:MAG: sulfurtransferase TusA family protein [Eubacteriales bacterium]